ncbi:hypothetical protein TWF481_005202 [Arthrobotrys musiformis]|uniref:Nephrocystin 3-like N-terminal domain-containing protein n=1 Tax=Arthrobotrys musiformis TaxID=47236 RepID=A0AAV9WD26_9PEZI
MHGGTDWQWYPEELKTFMFQTVRSSQSKPIILFADALDECDESEVREVVSFLEELSSIALSSKTSLRVLLSSRHYPTITMQRKLELIVESRVEHDQDISIYVRDKLKVGEGADEIEQELLRKAGGIFMWVVLVTQMLNQVFDEGRITAVWKRLREVPVDLDDVFRILLEKNNPYKNETVLMLQWVLFRGKMLTARELYYGVMAGTDPESLKRHDPSKITDETIIRFITNCSRGLVEVPPESSYVQFIHETVNDFLLRNKRLQTLDPTLAPQLAGRSHVKLAECCLVYLEAGDLSELLFLLPRSGRKVRYEIPEYDRNDFLQNADHHYPLLRYAVTLIFYHANLACPETQFQQFLLHRLLKRPKILWLIKYLYDYWKGKKYQRYGEDSNLLYILSFGGYRELVKTLLLEGWVNVNAICGDFGNALQAAMSVPAALGSRADIVKLLLDAGADVNALGPHGGVLQAALFASESRDRGYASRFGYFDYNATVTIINILLSAGADVNTRGGPYGNALQAACAFTYYNLDEEREEIVRVLLDAGADVNAQGGEFGNALQAALENLAHLAGENDPGHLPVRLVQTLVDAGADVNQVGSRYGNPLLVAIYRASAVIERENNIECGPASRYRYEATGSEISPEGARPPKVAPTAIIRILLAHGADVNAPVEHYGTVLQAAAFLDCRSPPFDILRILLAAGADSSIEKGYYGGVIQATVSRVVEFPTDATEEHPLKVVEILLEHGANINATGGPYGSALHAAVRIPTPGSGFETRIPTTGTKIPFRFWQPKSGTARLHVTQFLLQAGANPNVESGEFGSIAQSVVLQGAFLSRQHWPDTRNAAINDPERLLGQRNDGGALKILEILKGYGAVDATEAIGRLDELYGRRRRGSPVIKCDIDSWRAGQNISDYVKIDEFTELEV